MKNFFSGLPKPVLKKAEKYIQAALNEHEKKEDAKNASSLQTKVNAQNVTKTLFKEQISLSEVIAWAKENHPNKENVGFAVIKDKSDKLEYELVVYMVYIQDGKPLLCEEYKSLSVYVNKLDDKLVETFGNCDVIEFE